MKIPYILSIGLAALSLCGVTSCNDNDYEWNLPTSAEDGKLVNVVIPVTTCPATSVTRQAITPQAESHYDDLWIFFFKENGQKQTLVHRSQRTDSIHVTLPTGNYYIYGVANLSSSEEHNSLSHDIRNVEDLSTLKKVVATQELKTVFRNSGHLLMSGVYDDGNEATAAGLANITLRDQVLNPLKLQRLDARVTFNFSLDPEVIGQDGVKFETLRWQVFNLAGSTRLFPNDVEEADTHFSMSESLLFENDTVNATTGVTTSSFTFYSLPNSMRGTGAVKWSDREKRNDSGFVNAPAGATYVQLTGYYSHQYVDSLGVACVQRGNIRYTIHLGYLGEDAYNNYEIKRNTAYTYNVLVRGIDDIIVKVNTDPLDPNDGADGDIINGRFVYDVDCHYDREILSFNRDSILSHANLQGFYVKTPFEENFYYIPGETTVPHALPADQAKDYQWVKFRRNNITSYGIYSASTFAPYHPDNVLDVKQLLRELHTGTDSEGTSIYDKEGNVYYTMFIQENYYTHDPLTGFIAPQDFWKKFVNKDPREMYILCDYKQSKDHKSSISSAFIQLRQRSIRTIYNTETGSELKTAWGVETINETGALQTYTLNPWEGITDPNNGIANQTAAINLVGQKWNKFLTYNYADNDNDRNQLANSSEYDSFIFAMIQRNRDLNGNGIIDAEELKWYPATSNQYVGLWVGSHSIPNETRLYRNGRRDYCHYLSSDGREFLAEEGGTAGRYGENFGVTGGFSGSKPGTKYDYRCVRMLGFSDTDYANQATPQPYATVDAAAHRIDLKYLDKQSHRPDDFSISNEAEATSAESYLNAPYGSFYYADVDVTMGYTPYDLLTGSINSNPESSPCASLNKGSQKGWRVPNEREMNIMLSVLDEGWSSNTSTPSYYLTRTYGASYLDLKRGSLYLGVIEPVDGGNNLRYMTLPSAVQNVRVRCVRDNR